MRELVCIVCPTGCRLKATQESGNILVEGARCVRGRKYAREEMTCPVRIVTSTVAVQGGLHRRLPVKSLTAVPREAIAEIMRELRQIQLLAPVESGRIILENAGGTGIPVVATRDMPAKLDTAVREGPCHTKAVGKEKN